MSRQISNRSNAGNFANDFTIFKSRQSNLCFVANCYACDLTFGNINNGFQGADISNGKKNIAGFSIVAFLEVTFRNNAISGCYDVSATQGRFLATQVTQCSIQLSICIFVGKAVVVNSLLGNSASLVKFFITFQITSCFAQIGFSFHIFRTSLQNFCINVHLFQSCKHLSLGNLVAFFDKNFFNATVNLRCNLCLPFRIKTTGENHFRHNGNTLRQSSFYCNFPALVDSGSTLLIFLDIIKNTVAYYQAKQYA